MLSACAGSDSRTPLPAPERTAIIIPELSAEDARPCYDPGVPDGASALEIIADTRVALGVCSRRQARVVAQYEQVRGIVAPQGKETQE